MKSILVSAILLFSLQAAGQTIWLDEADLSAIQSGWGSPQARHSVEGNPLTIAGKTYDHGVGTHAVSTWLLRLDGAGRRFTAMVGIDDEVGKANASVEFLVLGDRNVLWQSGIMKKGDPAKNVDVALDGVKLLGLLVTDAGDGIDYDHADWADARIDCSAPRRASDLNAVPPPAPYILTPPESPGAEIHGPSVYGARPGHPILFKIPATGKKPITFSAERLPNGLTIDPSTGIISGVAPPPGAYEIQLTAKNDLATSSRTWKLISGDTICRTPPMGWNSWNCWAEAVDDAKVRAAADAMASSGLIDHGWTYINIDDCWMVKPDSKEPLTAGVPRDQDGMIRSNGKFPDMHALSTYVHGKGLKLGIYSSPGPLTCAGYTASYQHEEHDAKRFAEWGIDYLKYDWCSYDHIAPSRDLPELKKPYKVMRAALDKVPRDIVFSLCQYGMGDVWKWGAEVGGNCWRTTGDITDTWPSMSKIGFGQAGHEIYAGPGHWNDPDMLVVGDVGWGPSLHPTHLTPDEQYTHISLWSLLAAPLLIGCDLSHLDAFTKGLLTNDEVIAVNQDELGRQAARVSDRDGIQIWVKDLADGSKAVGIFNVGQTSRKTPADYFDWNPVLSARVHVSAGEIGMHGTFSVRDLWRQKDLGNFSDTFDVDVPAHGVVLVKVAGTGK